MIPGPIIIKKCSKCSGFIIENSMVSGNSFGATFWTDGKMDAPMFLNDESWFVKCPHCQALIWIDEQDTIRLFCLSGKNWKKNMEDAYNYEDAKAYDRPKPQDYFTELKKSNLGREKERHLRLRAWWAGNDKRRGVNNIERNLQDEEKGNFETGHQGWRPHHLGSPGSDRMDRCSGRLHVRACRW